MAIQKTFFYLISFYYIWVLKIYDMRLEKRGDIYSFIDRNHIWQGYYEPMGNMKLEKLKYGFVDGKYMWQGYFKNNRHRGYWVDDMSSRGYRTYYDDKTFNI